MERLLAELDEDERAVELSNADEAYRFRHRGSGFGEWCSVLVERRGERVSLIAEAGLTTRICRPLTAAEWGRLQAAVERVEFWTLPAWHDRHGFDGWTWTVEGRCSGRYHIAEGWCPSRGEPLHGLGIVLAGLADIRIDDERGLILPDI